MLLRPIIAAMEGTAEAEREGEIAFEAYGVRTVVIARPPELLDSVRPFLPPGWQPCSSSSVEARFEILTASDGTYAITIAGNVIHERLELDMALAILDSRIRAHLGVNSPHTVFIHAGAVEHRGRILVLPGRSFAGKTTMVRALVGAGATYYSDEFAVLDEDGLVHPYAKPLSVRDGGRMQTEHQLDSLGWVAGEQPLALSLVAVVTYRQGAVWQPNRLSAGEGAMALLANAVPARERPEQVIRTISRAVEGATVIEGERGEAEAIAPLLLTELETAP